MNNLEPFRERKFPKSRIATVDVCALGVAKHHVAGLLEVDVTNSREKIRIYKHRVAKISFTAWLLKTICYTIRNHQQTTAYLKGRRKIVVFDNINVSFLVEKELNGEKVPFPLLLEHVNDLSMESITTQLNASKQEVLSEKHIVLQSQSTRVERLYYHLPGFLRRFIWKLMLKRPDFVFNRMGNVAVTSVGMMGKINGWFIPISVHPICFGLGSIIKKPVVINDKIEIREMMNISVLIDHDVIDGAPIARFIKELTKNIEGAKFL